MLERETFFPDQSGLHHCWRCGCHRWYFEYGRPWNRKTYYGVSWKLKSRNLQTRSARRCLYSRISLLLDDRAIQRVLRDVDNNDLAVALKGCERRGTERYL